MVMFYNHGNCTLKLFSLW